MRGGGGPVFKEGECAALGKVHGGAAPSRTRAAAAALVSWRETAGGGVHRRLGLGPGGARRVFFNISLGRKK